MIIYFSGTGNTRRVAEALAAALSDNHLHELSPEELRNPASFCDMPVGEERVVWCFPVYSWGVPPVVVNFLKRFKAAAPFADALHHMVATCGDDIGRTDRQWRRIMASRGLRTGGAYAVQMPNTYVLMKGFDVDSPEVTKGKLKASAEAVKAIAASIEEGGPDILIPGKFPGIKTSVIYPWFKRFAMSPKPFHATAACVGCGICSRTCPMQNITPDSDDTPRWGKACALCLRCYHTCPRRAVAYGHATDGKGQKQVYK